MRKIDRKETEKLRDFPILWMEIIEYAIHMEGKECKDH